MSEPRYADVETLIYIKRLNEKLAAKTAECDALKHDINRYREAEKALPEKPHIHHVFLEKPFSGEGVNVPAVLKEDYDKLRAHAIAKATECERLREDATRTLWAVVFAAGGDVAVPHSLLISQDKQNILERIEYPSMTTVFKAARKETQ